MPRKTRFEDIAVGEQLPPFRRVVTRQAMDDFARFLGQISNDPNERASSRNPHVNEEYARQHIFGGLFADGNHTVAYLCQMATDWLPVGSMLGGDCDVDVKFPNPVRPDDELSIGGEVAETFTRDNRNYVVLRLVASNQRERVVAAGTLTTYVPG